LGDKEGQGIKEVVECVKAFALKNKEKNKMKRE